MSEFQLVSVVAKSGWSSLANLVLMACLSVGVWAIIAMKWFENRRRGVAVQRWAKSLSGKMSFPEIRKIASSLPETAFGRIANSALREIETLSKYVSFDSLDSRSQLVEEAIERSVDREKSLNDRFLSYLAICGAVGPLLGLLGTVWGVMKAFLEIGMQGSANITVVAPGIAQALVTTIGGLLVAIPAAVSYNYFVSFNRKSESRMYGFGSELVSLFKRGDLTALERSASR
ncbi:MAG: MotA/TolQ/ExbB proton channel family protein [Okeania sp. SIO1H5]|uniref:MotA/TolQ/ExbB proton channel family protein n=1 Tax=Okeania sp. SIO1H5 TaxID=2607777 RepID=UPI0013B97388|nr:MotA/TolQ/ExbB proton channel family protein [Okeania sp. SIO1H5]NET23572.1 MotA/TolQ/ExbB proton channel family protein [Okeania sp. SIO1H5]